MTDSIQPRRRLQTCAGFTLIELLVTIAIMSLLMAVVVPAVSGAREAGKRAKCGTHLREIAAAALMYIQTEHDLPTLNNQPDDGHWQYNYLIFDGRDYDQNFGPYVRKNLIPDLRLLYCPSQSSTFHTYNTFVNPWPPQAPLDTRAAYCRRMRMTGLDVTRMPVGTAFFADVFQTPQYIKTAHAKGVNTSYIDGHVSFVTGAPLLLNNQMSLPTPLLDNPVIAEIWKQLDGQ